MSGAETTPGAMSKRRLKLWIRLLRVTRMAEAELREFLRLRHATTLPRFDVMAALFRRRDGVTMSELSRMLLVSNGNATAVVDRLERERLVRREPVATDRRTVRVTLTEAGLAAFERQAAEHEAEVDRIFGALGAGEVDQMTEVLKRIGKGDGA